MKGWLILIAAFLLWPGYSSQNVCEEPDEIDFGEIVSTEKAKYLENDQVQYRCNPGYVLEGPEWIQCKGQEWTPRLPKCLAPCRITRQQLSTKNMFAFGGQRKTRFIQSNDSLQFHCSEGYVLVAPSVRKCVDGYMELPLCISERGKNCSGPPKIQNGDITTLSEKQYRSGSLVEFRCQRFYAMEGQNRSFCDNGTWTKVPICLNPCIIAKAELERQKIEVKDGMDASESIFVQRGHSVELTCKTGYALEGDSSQSASIIHCDGTPPVIPNCEEITCNSPRLLNGNFRPQRTIYHDGDLIRIRCDSGFTFKPDNEGQVAECTKNGWLPPPKCVTKNACGLPPRREREQPVEELDAETYVNGREISYKCRPGYVKAWRIKLKCNEGVWQQLAPFKSCIGISCGHPGDSDYASFEFDRGEDFTFGARVVYTCNEGYKMLSQFDYRECRADGWTNEVPHCETKSACGLPPRREREQPVEELDAETYVNGREISYKCRPGYVKAWRIKLKCNEGVWQQLAPIKSCIGISCGHPGDSDYASFEFDRGEDFTFGARVVYTCNEGYKMLSQFDYRECQAVGWTNEVPHCEKIQCPPPEVRGGRFQPRQPQYMYNEEIEINCLEIPISMNIKKKVF